MPILTKAPITKGTPAVFTLDKDALALNATVAANSYFSNNAKWKHVSLAYKSATSNQNKVLLVNLGGSEVNSNFKTSLFCDDVFLIQNITLHDFDGGSFLIPRSALNVADFDIDMTPVTALWSHSFTEPSLYGEALYAATITGGKLIFNKAYNTTNVYYNNPTISFGMQGTGPQILIPQSVGPLTYYNFRIYVDSILPPEGLTALQLANGGGTYTYTKANAEILNDITTKGYIEFTSFTIWDASGSLELKILSTNIDAVVLTMTRFEIHPLA